MMRRLWVRLSLLIGGLLLLVVLLLGAVFALHIVIERQMLAAGADVAPLADALYQIVGLLAAIGVIGLGAAVFASRIISAPVARLAEAAHRIGAGELDTRVEIRGSQELEDLAHSFNTMAANLQHAETLRRHVMADIAHELRTPLTVLEGRLRAAIDQITPIDEEGITRLYSQTRHLSRLVHDLRELALADAGQLSLHLHLLDLSSVVNEVSQLFAPLADEHGIALRTQSDSVAYVQADPGRIRQVFDNLLSNAVRHTPQGGSICVAVEREHPWVHLLISDTGDGLSSEQQEAIFDRFYRTDISRNRETGGSGLGLAIVKAIIEAHGGTITVRSTGIGHGSVFCIDLPAAESPYSERPSA